MAINLDKEIWEGWTVGDFVNDMVNTFDTIMAGRSWKKPFTSYEELKQWCMDEQPYYKKHIPEVYQFFKTKYDEKN